MISYRFMSMSMEDNLNGSAGITPDDIVTTIPNRFANPPMMPPTLRVVPIDMTTDMHMLGAMYAPSDSVTLMAMLNYLEKDMSHITYQGGMGTNQLGRFVTETSGLGDASLTVLWNIAEDYSDDHDTQFILNFGVSIPTGDIDATGQILTPMNMQPTPRLPYAMQLGSGTWDLIPGITYATGHDNLGWGAQMKATIRLSDNDEGYSLGNKIFATSWVSYKMSDMLSVSLRLSYTDQEDIDGMDSQIMAPVQTADPDNYGGERLDLGVGANILLSGGHRLAFEYETTLDQDANGVQMEMQNMLTLGYQKAF